MLSFVRPDAHPDFATEAQKLLDEVRQEVAKRHGVPHSDDFEKRQIWSGTWRGDGRHKKTLAGQGVAAAKCGYCEQIREVARDLDVEHYRPKVKITRWAGQPPLVSNTPPEQILVGPGYWWLAFSWENYSLSCKGCNQGWKRSLFPVRDPRPGCAPGVEKLEQPLLLDPSRPFKTRDHFTWTPLGYMEGVSPEGSATIITCGLNRTPLPAMRMKLVQLLVPVLHDLVVGLRRDEVRLRNRAIGQLSLLGSRAAEFAGMVRWFTEDALGWDWERIPGLPA